MLLEIRKLNVDSIDLDEAVAALALSRAIAAEYVNQSLTPPDWLSERVAELDKEVKSRKRDYLERSLKAAKARKEALKTADQKRADAEAEIARLEAALNG